MLFTYKYVHGHEIEKFQRYCNFLFLKVWLPAKGKFSSAKLRGFPELQKIYERLHYEDSKGAQFFNGHIEMIFNHFLPLSKTERKKMKKWYLINNKIEALCCDKRIIPKSYKSLEKKYPDLTKHVKSFYSKLYDTESPFTLAAFGDLKKIKANHYGKFIDLNFGGHEGICPFCGINSIKGNDHTKLEAYDHYLPKGTYPFNSINFRNLSPACHECNSSYKHEKDPTRNLDPIVKNRVRRKSFYPYSKRKPSIDINIGFNKYHDKLTKGEITITFNSTEKEQVESWDETYGITERYKAKLLGDFSGRAWYDKFENGIHIARKKYNPNLTYAEWAQDLIDECDENPLVDMQFLKKPFFQECLRTHV